MTAENTNHQSQEETDHPEEDISDEDSCYTMMDADEFMDDRCSELFCCCC